MIAVRALAGAAAALAALSSGCAAQSPGVESAVYSGVYREGFEQSDFYPDAGGGPWWLSAEEAEWTAIQAFKPQTGSRGDAAIVRIEVEGELRGPFDPQIREAFENSIHVTRILSIAPITDDVFQAAAEKARAAR